MKRLLVSFMAVFVAMAQNQADRTHDLINGRYWIGQTAEEQVAYVVGFCDGMYAEFNAAFPAGTIVTGRQIRESRCPHITFGEMCDFLNDFYKDPLNRPIPVADALGAARLKADGASREDFETHIAALRKSSK